jgi:hypothetical protein
VASSTGEESAQRACWLRQSDHEAVSASRTTKGFVDLIVVSMWASEDAIRQFAGSDFQRAVVADDARRILRSFDDKVRHYSVVAHDRMTCLDQQLGGAAPER